MKSSMRLKYIPLAILMAYGAGFGVAHAEFVSGVCLANDVNICENRHETIPSSGILMIRGYAFDLATGERPVDGAGGFVRLRNEDTLIDYKVPIQRIEARPDVVANSITGTIVPSQYEVVNAGFIAQVFMASLPKGSYTVQEVRLNMKLGGLVKVPMDSADKRGTFIIGDSASPFRLVKPDGTSLPLTMGKPANGVVPAAGYPPLRDGKFTVVAKLPAIGSTVEQSVEFEYKRPILSVPISVPIVEQFPGVVTRITPTNPLNNRPIDVGMLPAIVDTDQGDDVTINGQEIGIGNDIGIERMASLSGVYQINFQDTGDIEKQQVIKLWVDLPDAPNIHLVSNRWDPAKKISITKTLEAAAVKVEELDVNAKLIGGSPDTCQTLSTVRPNYSLGAVYGVNCAIRFGDLPEGFKYNPYAANSLRGSLSLIGSNEIDYVPGVLYQDPESKKTIFHPAKNGSGKVTMTGVEPDPIEIGFVSDKALKDFNASNAEKFPGKEFAFVDRNQARTLGMVDIKAGHRFVMTRITYPGNNNFKEAYSSVLESKMAMAFKAENPWAEFPVKVESWYHNAPEYKTEKTFDFVGVPLPPAVLFEKIFVSHDKADTIISGQMGLSKGQNLLFDPATMGQWQIIVREEKGKLPMGVPVDVDANGNFTANLGTLTAGTRYIVAEAKMVSGAGLVMASSVTTKARALVTAAGESIEATLSARVMSGKAPFVQTIYANVKNAKMLSNVKVVIWETLKEDGTWERIMRGEDLEQTGINYLIKLDEPGQRTYRAVLVNKHSGLEYATEPLTLHAFELPTYRVNVPGVVQVKRPVTFTIDADEGFDAIYTWRLLTTSGYEQVSASTGKTFTFTPTELRNYSVEVLGRSAAAPDNPAADVKKTIGVKAVNPLAARASIKGPNYLETGVPYTFNATINDVVPSSSIKAYEMKGYWMLSDGTRVDSNQLIYTPRVGDSTLTFYTYVDGYPEETSVVTFPFKTWTYNFPTSWRVRLVPSTLDVPASIKYYVEAPNFDLRTLNGEPLTYTWSLPENVTRGTGNDITGNLIVNKNGTYQVAVQVADTRGNAVNVTSGEFTIIPPASLQLKASITSKYGEKFYAPGTYYIGMKINEVPRGDSFLRNEVLINGNKVGEFTGSGHYVSLPEAGNYEIKLRTVTKGGNYGEEILNVEVLAAPEPQCTIRQNTTNSGVMLTPDCMVDVGHIKSLTWTYKLDGINAKATSKSFLVVKDWIAKSRISDLTLTIETDLGFVKAEPVTFE